jgi:hypothetical protein
MIELVALAKVGHAHFSISVSNAAQPTMSTPGERLRPRRSRVAALALEHQQINKGGYRDQPTLVNRFDLIQRIV